MPVISQFGGITIEMYHRDHPPAHFHARYGEDEAIYEISTQFLLKGHLPRRIHAQVVEWARLHAVELEANWQRARQRLELQRIEPLE